MVFYDVNVNGHPSRDMSASWLAKCIQKVPHHKCDIEVGSVSPTCLAHEFLNSSPQNMAWCPEEVLEKPYSLVLCLGDSDPADLD